MVENSSSGSFSAWKVQIHVSKERALIIKLHALNLSHCSAKEQSQFPGPEIQVKENLVCQLMQLFIQEGALMCALFRHFTLKLLDKNWKSTESLKLRRELTPGLPLSGEVLFKVDSNSSTS